MAAEAYPEVASQMNSAGKIVFSNIIEDPKWNNTRVISGDIVEQVRQLKQQPGNDMTVLGSGSIVSQFAEAGLVDEYQIMIDPVALGSGTPIFRGIKKKLDLKLVECKTFKSGIILLRFHKRA